MALFSDGSIAQMEDLRARESAVLELAATEGIDVAAKLRLAQIDLGTELTPFLTSRRSGLARDLSNVVVTPALATAHAVYTLAMIYRDLYQSRYNDRYEGKWREYAAQSGRALQALLDAGIGICIGPISKAGNPTLSSAVGGALPARTAYVAVAWTREGRITGSLSDVESLSIGSENRLKVQAPARPAGINGWVVYAGRTPDSLQLQSESSIEGSEWTEPNTGLRTDLTSWPVQRPDFYLENRRELLRG